MEVVLIAVALANSVPWDVRPDGPQGWAVSKSYGSPQWSGSPDVIKDTATIDICREVPDWRDARFIADALNQRDGTK